MFSVGSSPYNGLLSSLYGGSAKRRAWLNSVKSGRVKRDSKGRFLPRGSGGGKSRKKSSRRYKASSYFDVVDPDVSITAVRSGGISQAGVDRAAMNLTQLKRKWDYYKDFMDADDQPAPEMYPLAGKILRNLKYLQRAQKLDYYPTYPVPQFQPWDQHVISGMADIGFATKRMGGREYDRQVALELASAGQPNVPRSLKRQRVRWAMKNAKKRMGADDMEQYADVWNYNYNDPDTGYSGGDPWGTASAPPPPPPGGEYMMAKNEYQPPPAL